MKEIKGEAKFEDIKKGKVLWEVDVVLFHDGRVEAYPPKKLIPLSDPYLGGWGINPSWVFNLHNCSGMVVPSYINERNVLTPDGKTHMLDCDWDAHNRLFKKRKDGMEYALMMRDYKMTDYELEKHLEMALYCGEDANGELVPLELYPNSDPDAYYKSKGIVFRELEPGVEYYVED